MSHIAEMNIEIKDLDALEKSCEKLGLELVRGQQTYRWYGRSVGDYPIPAGFTEQDLGKCEHAIRVKNNGRAYEVGVTPRRDGRPGYTLLWDFWSGGYGLEDKVGKNGDHLKQQYTTEVSRKYWTRQGYRVTEIEKEDGTRIVTASR